MNKKRFILGLILFGLGFIGILSMLTMEIPLPPEAEAMLKDLTPLQINLIILANPTIMLLVSIIIGTSLCHKVKLHVPVVENIVGIKSDHLNIPDILKYGILGGVLSGILLSLVSLIFTPILPAEFLELGETLKPTLAARFLYAGLTEELFMRFGLMTLFVWIAFKIFKGTKPVAYWTGIILAALIFAVGHFPIAYNVIGNPSIGLLTYILLGNTIGGLIFGWLYWKKGLESAFVAHIFTHVILVAAEPMMG